MKRSKTFAGFVVPQPGLSSPRSFADENELIDRIAESIRFFGCDQDDNGEFSELVQFALGHSGEGWYLSCAQYPDEGAVFIGPLEYGAIVVAQAIVAEERAALALNSQEEDSPIKCGTFSTDEIPADVRATMDADRELAQRDRTDPAPDLLSLLIEARNGLAWYRAEFPDADGRSDEEVLERIDAAIAQGTLHPELVVPAVSFRATLLAVGDAEELRNMDLPLADDAAVLVFRADAEECEKTGPIFRRTVRLTAKASGP